jgi:hypothetical protein
MTNQHHDQIRAMYVLQAIAKEKHLLTHLLEQLAAESGAKLCARCDARHVLHTDCPLPAKPIKEIAI